MLQGCAYRVGCTIPCMLLGFGQPRTQTGRGLVRAEDEKAVRGQDSFSTELPYSLRDLDSL